MKDEIDVQGHQDRLQELQVVDLFIVREHIYMSIQNMFVPRSGLIIFPFQWDCLRNRTCI